MSAAGSTGVDVEGELYWLDSRTFERDDSRRFTEDSTVSMILAEDETLTTVVASNGSFSLDGVLEDELSLAVALPGSGSLGLPTISWVDTRTSPQALSIPVAAASALDEAYAVVSTPEARNGNDAQIVLRFTFASTGNGVTGVKLEPPGSAKVLYDAGGTWTDGDRGTGSRGFVLIENVSVTGLGLYTLSLHFADESSISDALGVLVAAGMVTYLDVAVDG